MKSLRIFVFLIIIILISACGELNKEQPALNDTTSSVSATPQPSKTAQPTNTAIPTQPIVPIPDICSKQTVPVDVMGLSQSDLYTNKFVAYALENDKGSSDIYVANWDGNNKRNISNNPADDANPQWSPDGEHISFLSNRNSSLNISCNGASDDCKYELFVTTSTGSGLIQITKGWTFSPAWSPDGRQVLFLGAFKSELSPNPNDSFLYDIFVVHSDGSNLRNLTNSPGYYFDPIWSPDGRRIAFRSEEMAAYPNSINIINVDGTNLSAYSDQQSHEIVWAPDSRSLLIATQSNNSSGNAIYKLQVDSLSLEQLTFSSKEIKDMLALSPDGKWLAYHLRPDYQHLESMCDQIRVLNTETLKDYFVYDAKDIEKITIDNGGTSPLYSGLSISSVIWAPDSKRLIFRQEYQIPMIFGDFNGTFSIRLDGSQLEHLGANIEAFQP